MIFKKQYVWPSQAFRELYCVSNRNFLGPLAQLVEHRTFNPLVVGSNPTRPTNF